MTYYNILKCGEGLQCWFLSVYRHFFILVITFLVHIKISLNLKDIDDCSPDPCMNGATCMDGIDSYTCACVAGYTGDNCSTGIMQYYLEMHVNLFIPLSTFKILANLLKDFSLLPF